MIAPAGHREIPLPIAADHPAFEGHFPGHPILPGVVLLAEVLAAIEGTAGRSLGAVDIRQVKFHATVAPGTQLKIRLSPVAGGALAFEVSAGPTRVASGTIDPEPSAAEDPSARP